MTNLHVENRQLILRRLREEIVGPCAHGKPVEPRADGSIQVSQKESRVPRVLAPDGAELLQVDAPRRRYGSGVLTPIDAWGTPAEALGIGTESESEGEPDEEQELRERIRLERQQEGGRDDSAGEDDEVGRRSPPGTPVLGISFQVRLPEAGSLSWNLPSGDLRTGLGLNGRYERVSVHIDGDDRTSDRHWWVRRQVVCQGTIDASALVGSGIIEIAKDHRPTEGPLSFQIVVRSRPAPGHEHDAMVRLVTVSLVNRTSDDGNLPLDARCLFQSCLEVQVMDAAGTVVPAIMPYPQALRNAGAAPDTDGAERLGLELLHLRRPAFAVGHSCSVDWSAGEGTSLVGSIRSEAMPVVELPSVTADITDAGGRPISVGMRALAGWVPGYDGMEPLMRLAQAYRAWIGARRAEAVHLPAHLQAQAAAHLSACDEAASRIEDGIAALQEPTVGLAFRLANQAMLIQQMCRRKVRLPTKTAPESPLVYAEQAPDPVQLAQDPAAKDRHWRAFQIAFLLMNLRSAADPSDARRATVDLIWFPTGGGKTESYLGLTAFAILHRRLKAVSSGSDDRGVQVLMRYTLRLLTAQQFQRASSLLCAMDRLRVMDRPRLGERPFRIGIWLGNQTTPGSWEDARKNLRQLKEDPKGSESRMLVDRCPWCGAMMGKVQFRHGGRDRWEVCGYLERHGKVYFQCPDPRCAWHGQDLPIEVVDDGIYESRPSLLIGTIDKFAMLAWRPQARCIFGLDGDGRRVDAPPGLIIQDELHLISGPLGTLAGLYEPVIEQLCSWTSDTGKTILPKIVCSTATIRSWQEQIRALYGRTDARLFPPPGLDIEDSFFGVVARDLEGRRQHGRMHVGVFAPGHGSGLTTNVRSFSSMTASAMAIPADQRDPWWTTLVFHNSLRELGFNQTLCVSDIPPRLAVVHDRYGDPRSQRRYLNSPVELSGRLRNDEIPERLEMLERPITGDKAKDARTVDICLASNIIEVGIDIDRINILAVCGQPKSAAQYIQVTGRCGRQWYRTPGLVVVIHNPNKPRDRSHYERFRDWHEHLYQHVESVSVTPFSPAALTRALHAGLVAWIRQTTPQDGKARVPCQVESSDFGRFREFMRERCRTVDPEEVPRLERMLDLLIDREWLSWRRTIYQHPAMGGGPEHPLMRPSGSHIPDGERDAGTPGNRLVWQVPQSMRNVDAECRVQSLGLRKA